MVPLASLWLPVLLSAVIVFVARSIIHMASPWRKNDDALLPDEEKVRTALRPFAIPPGDYNGSAAADPRGDARTTRTVTAGAAVLSV